jgi:hypothetical protein
MEADSKRGPTPPPNVFELVGRTAGMALSRKQGRIATVCILVFGATIPIWWGLSCNGPEISEPMGSVHAPLTGTGTAEVGESCANDSSAQPCASGCCVRHGDNVYFCSTRCENDGQCPPGPGGAWHCRAIAMMGGPMFCMAPVGWTPKVANPPAQQPPDLQ